MLSSDSILGPDFAIMVAGMDGLAQRQQVHAENLGNIDTPGYHARTVDFEAVLKNALSSVAGNGTGPMSANGAMLPNAAADAITSGKLSSQFAVTEQPGAHPSDRAQEVSAMMNDNLRFRMLTNQVNNRISELKNVISEMGRG
jgi:flagellar basal-body rod protein FlgB